MMQEYLTGEGALLRRSAFVVASNVQILLLTIGNLAPGLDRAVNSITPQISNNVSSKSVVSLRSN